MENTEIYYFSGSGNSFVVALEIQNKLNIPLFDIASEIKYKKYKSEARSIGFIFPCHGFTIPSPVKTFIDKIEMDKAQYVFVAATRSGTVFRGFEYINKALKRKNLSLDASFVIDMPCNNPKFENYKVPTYAEVEKCHKKLESKLDIITECIQNQDEYSDSIHGVRMTKYPVLNKILEKLVAYSVHNISPKVKNYFYTTDECIGCGTCKKICPSGKIKMVNGKPVWDNTKPCYMCYACLNFCPIESVQINSKFCIKSHTLKNGRYHHPDVTASDMGKDD